MKNYLKLLFWFIFLLWFTHGYSSQYFDITTNKHFAGWNEISVKIKGIKSPTDVTLKIWDKEMKLKSAVSNIFTFTVPVDFKLSSSNLKTNVSVNGGSYDAWNWPYLESVAKSGTWQNLLVKWTFTWACVLKLNEWTSLSITKWTDWQYYSVLPTDLTKTIDGWYLVCDDVGSNYLDLNIAAPQIFYLKAVDGSTIEPEESVVLKWKNFKITNTDTFVLTFDGKEVKDYEVRDAETIFFKLPKENIKNKKVKLKINGKDSNDLYVQALEYPKISNISYEYQELQYVIKIDWDFDYTLWNLSVYYGNNKLTVVKTWANFIYVAFPTVTREKNSSTWKDVLEKFSCSYYLTPNDIRVDIWSVSSNKFFTYLDIIPKIKSVQIPYCNSSSCYLTFSVTNLSKWRYVKIKYNGVEYSVYNNESDTKFTIDTKTLVKDWKLEIYTDQCLYSQTFYFDYSRQLKPKIFKIEWNWFKSGWSFTIYWENFANVMVTNADKLNVSLSPDYMSKNEKKVPILTKWQSEVKWTLSIPATAQTWQSISASLSNEMGQSNWVKFQTYSTKKEYLWNPEIYFVSFPDWFGSWEKAIIEWVWFSDKCNEDIVYFEDVKVTPTSCSYKSLTVLIPDKESNEIKVERLWLTSNIYKLNFIFWGSSTATEFDLSAEKLNLKKTLQKDTSLEFNIKVKNTLWNVYLENLYIDFEWIDYVPFSDFKIQVWDDSRRYIYRSSSRELIKTEEQMIWYLKKVWENKYQLIFNDLYIPYSKDWVVIKIKSTIDSNYSNNVDIKFSIPAQTIAYNLMYGESKKYQLDLKNIDMGDVSLVWWIWNKCFASVWYESYCLEEEDTTDTETEEEDDTTTVELEDQDEDDENTEDEEDKDEDDIIVTTWDNVEVETWTLLEEFNNKQYLKLANKITDSLVTKVCNVFDKYTASMKSKYWNSPIIEKMISTNKDILSLSKNINNDSKLEIAKNVYKYIYYVWLSKERYLLTKKWDNYEEKYLKLANKMDEEYMKNMNLTMEKILELYVDKIKTNVNAKKMYDVNASMKLIEQDTSFQNKIFFAQKMYEFYDAYSKVKWKNK